MAVLGETGAGLTRPFPLIQHTLKPLGRRQARYDIQPAHYHTFATALADTLGNTFTAEVEASWMEAHYLVLGIMKESRD